MWWSSEIVLYFFFRFEFMFGWVKTVKTHETTIFGYILGNDAHKAAILRVPGV